MQAVIPGQANTVKADLVSRSSGAPITVGTVTFYLVALNGPNAGKWFRASDSFWQAAESSAGSGTHLADGHWTCEIAAAAWSYGVIYLLYVKEGGDLHTPYSEQIVPSLVVGAVGTGATPWSYTVTDSGTGNPIEGVTVWVTNDQGGANVIAKDATGADGSVTFYLKPGTYYIWCQKTGYSFDNPDAETVT